MPISESLPLPGFEPIASDELTCSAAPRPAKTRAAQTKKEKASMASEQSSSLNSAGSLRNYDPVGRVLKTAISSWVAEGSGCLVDWRLRASKSNRSCFRLVPLALRTSEKDYSLSVGTPTKLGVSKAGPSTYDRERARGDIPSAAALVKRAKVPTPRKNKYSFPDSHGTPFEATELGSKIIAALGGETGSKGLAATYQALMGYPPHWLSEPLRHMETPSSRKSRTRSAAPSSPPKKTRLSASKQIVDARKLGALTMSKLALFAKGGLDKFTPAERASLISAGLAFVHDKPEPRLMLTEAGWAMVEGRATEQPRKGRGQ